MDSILKWLSRNGYEYTWNFKLGSKIPDLIAFKENEVLAFEFKKWAKDFSDALGQCLFYQERANATYIVLPYDEIKKIDNAQMNSAKKNGIGIIGLNKTVKLFLRPRFEEKDVTRIREEIRKKSFVNIASPLPNGHNSEGIKSKILGILEEHTEGLSISDVAKISHFHRHTITKYMHELIGAAMVHQRDLGTIKLHYLTKDYNPPESNPVQKVPRRKPYA